MFTYPQYLEVLKGIDEKGWYLKDEAIEKYYNDTRKTPMDYDSDDLFTVLTSYYSLGSVSMVAHRIDAFRNFYESLQAEGRRFDNPALDARINSTYIVKNTNYMRPCYSRSDVADIINCVPDQESRLWYEALVLTFYDGVSYALSDFATIRYSDFDQINKTVRGRIISDRLAYLYTRVADIDSIKGANGRTIYLGNHKNTLIPVGVSDKTTSISAYLCKKFNSLSKLSKREVNADLLYNSGFVWYLIDEVGEDMVFEMMDATRFSPKSMKRIAEVTTEYGYVETPGNLKRRIRVYVNSLRK